MQINSPNWYWKQLGANVVREGLVRAIYLDGIEVCSRAGYETEIGISRWLFERLPTNKQLGG